MGRTGSGCATRARGEGAARRGGRGGSDRGAGPIGVVFSFGSGRGARCRRPVRDGTGGTGRRPDNAATQGISGKTGHQGARHSSGGLVCEAGTEPGNGVLGRCAVEWERFGTGMGGKAWRSRWGGDVMAPRNAPDADGAGQEPPGGHPWHETDDRRSTGMRAADGTVDSTRPAGRLIVAVGAGEPNTGTGPGGPAPGDPPTGDGGTERAAPTAGTGDGGGPGHGTPTGASRAAPPRAAAAPMRG